MPDGSVYPTNNPNFVPREVKEKEKSSGSKRNNPPLQSKK